MNFDSRKYVFIVIFVLIGVVYAFKLFYMQVVDDSWKIRAQQIAEKRREITPPRAVVFDRNGEKIVANKTYYNLMLELEVKDLSKAWQNNRQLSKNTSISLFKRTNRRRNGENCLSFGKFSRFLQRSHKYEGLSLCKWSKYSRLSF